MTTTPMTPTELLRCPSDDLIAFSITEAFGERCPTTDADCYTCQAWSQYDKLRAAATPSAQGAQSALAQLDSADAVSSTTLARDWKTIEEQIASATPTELFSLFRDYLVMNSTSGDDLAPLYIARITAILSTGLLPNASPGNGAEKVRHVDLRSANLARQAEWDQDNQITLAYRGNELAGETGEACNVIKKLERERIGIRGSRDTVEHLAEELADVVICADLIAMQAGIDLDKAVRDKFNATSEKMNLKTRLAALHSTSAAGETTSSDGGGCMADFSSGDPNNLKELMAGPSVFDPPSEAADVLAMKEACKRVAEEYTRADNPDVVMVGDLIAAAIDKLSPEVKADASPPDWKQDQAETTRIKPPATAEGGRDEPVAIKPLEWRDHRPDSFPEPAWSAQTPFGYYNIEEVSASDSPAYVVRLHAHHFIADKDSLEDAKGAAQADYEQRIRSALVVHPASPPDVEAIRADERERCATEVERRNWPTVGDARRIASAIRTGGQK